MIVGGARARNGLPISDAAAASGVITTASNTCPTVSNSYFPPSIDESNHILIKSS